LNWSHLEVAEPSLPIELSYSVKDRAGEKYGASFSRATNTPSNMHTCRCRLRLDPNLCMKVSAPACVLPTTPLAAALLRKCFAVTSEPIAKPCGAAWLSRETMWTAPSGGFETRPYRRRACCRARCRPYHRSLPHGFVAPTTNRNICQFRQTPSA